MFLQIIVNLILELVSEKFKFWVVTNKKKGREKGKKLL